MLSSKHRDVSSVVQRGTTYLRSVCSNPARRIFLRDLLISIHSVILSYVILPLSGHVILRRTYKINSRNISHLLWYKILRLVYGSLLEQMFSNFISSRYFTADIRNPIYADFPEIYYSTEHFGWYMESYGKKIYRASSCHRSPWQIYGIVHVFPDFIYCAKCQGWYTKSHDRLIPRLHYFTKYRG